MIIPSIFVCVIPTMWTVFLRMMKWCIPWLMNWPIAFIGITVISFFEFMRDILQEEYTVFRGLVDESEEDSCFIFD